jgi:hypothetical protein
MLAGLQSIPEDLYESARLDGAGPISRFEKAGLDPDKPPATFDELRADSQAIVDSGAATHGISFETSAWIIEQWFGLANEPFVNRGNGRDARATEVMFNNDLGLEIFTFIKQMVDDGLALNVGRNPSGADALLAIGSGDAAMTIGTSRGPGLRVCRAGERAVRRHGSRRRPATRRARRRWRPGGWRRTLDPQGLVAGGAGSRPPVPTSRLYRRPEGSSQPPVAGRQLLVSVGDYPTAPGSPACASP